MLLAFAARRGVAVYRTKLGPGLASLKYLSSQATETAITIPDTEREITTWLRHCGLALDNNNKLSAPIPVGFDVEWTGQGDDNVDLIQVACGSNVLLVRTKHIDALGQPFLDMLQSDQILKCGREIDLDMTKIQKYYQIQTAGHFEVGDHIGKFDSSLRRRGLVHIYNKLYNANVQKSKKVTCGDWSRRFLSSEQIAYAATDALMGLRIYEHLHSGGYISNISAKLPKQSKLISSRNAARAASESAAEAAAGAAINASASEVSEPQAAQVSFSFPASAVSEPQTADVSSADVSAASAAAADSDPQAADILPSISASTVSDTQPAQVSSASSSASSVQTTQDVSTETQTAQVSATSGTETTEESSSSSTSSSSISASAASTTRPAQASKTQSPQTYLASAVPQTAPAYSSPSPSAVSAALAAHAAAVSAAAAAASAVAAAEAALTAAQAAATAAGASAAAAQAAAQAVAHAAAASAAAAAAPMSKSN